MADDPQEQVWPPLDEVLQLAIKRSLAKVHTGFVATLVSYDAAKQTVRVQPVARWRRMLEDGTVESYRAPQLVDLPVEWPSAGSGTRVYSLTFPLVAGDPGMVRIMERSHDEWRATGNADTTPQYPRRFDSSDAVFFPGVRSPASPLQATSVDPAAMVLAFDKLKMGSNAAAHPAPFGDVLLRVLTGLREFLATVVCSTAVGPGLLTAVTSGYGSGSAAAIAAAMASDVADLTLNSQKVTLE